MSQKSTKVEGFDRVFNLVGGGGWYQWLLFAVCSLQAMLICFHHLGYVFLGAVPEHWCEIDALQSTNWTKEQIKNLSIPRKPTDTTKYDSCLAYDLDYTALAQEPSYEAAMTKANHSSSTPVKSCTSWTYDTSIYKETTVSEFNLVCDRRYLVATIQGTYMGGVVAGSLIMGTLSDNVLGRRNTVILSVCLVIVFGFATSFANSYATFVLARFFIAVGATGSFQNTFSLLTEVCDKKNRAKIGLFSNIPFAFGYMGIPIFAYFIRHWRNLQIAFSISTLILLSYFWLLPNSPRWLAMMGRHEEALKILNHVAKVNRRPKPHRLEMMVILEGCTDETMADRRPVSCCAQFARTLRKIGSGYVNLVRTPELRRRSFLIWFLFITVTLVYYGISFDSALLTNDPFLLVFLSGLMELPGYTIVVPFAIKWGRTPTVATTFLVTGVVCGIVAVVPAEYNYLRVVFAMVGKLFISGCFGVIYLLGAELYPTTERATGLGSAVLMGRIGSISAPYVVDLTRTIQPELPSIIFGVTGIVSGFVTLLLPETKDSALMDNIKSVEQQGQTEEGDAQIKKIARRLSHPYADTTGSYGTHPVISLENVTTPDKK